VELAILLCAGAALGAAPAPDWAGRRPLAVEIIEDFPIMTELSAKGFRVISNASFINMGIGQPFDGSGVLPRRAEWASLATALMATLMAAWFWSLKRQVRQRTEALREAMAAIRESESELKLSQESLAKAQSLAAIGNWEWIPATARVHWSDQMFRILGEDPGALRPSLKTVLARTHPDDRANLKRTLKRTLAGRESLPIGFRTVQRDGSCRFLHSLVEVEPGAEGQPYRFRGTVQDVTELRSTEEALRQAQKLESLGVLAGGIAHDFNNLLSAIGGNLELAQMNMRPEPAAAPFLIKIEKILKRASELTHQMLAYSGKGRIAVKKLSLNQIAEEMPHLLEVSISKRVRLDYRFEAHLPPIEADGAQVQQVIMNLVTNASEAIGDRDGTITLTTGLDYLENPQEQVENHGWTLVPGLYVTLEVADTGCGMNAETRRKLFDPFFTTKFSGRGLGLSAMLGILKGHNAGIRIRSRAGEGSSFKIFFPASVTGELPPPAPPPAVRTAVPTGSILLVDDEPDILEATAELLAAMGFKVDSAVDGLEAVAQFQANPEDYSLVLMDLTMPRMDGREALQALRHLAPELKVVLCSGFNEADVAGDFSGAQLSGFLQKPYTFQMLKDVVDKALA
jgi:PAS domain S-box-containing protein